MGIVRVHAPEAGLCARSEDTAEAPPRNEHIMCSFMTSVQARHEASGRTSEAREVCVREAGGCEGEGARGESGVHLDAQRRITCTRSHKTNILLFVSWPLGHKGE